MPSDGLRWLFLLESSQESFNRLCSSLCFVQGLRVDLNGLRCLDGGHSGLPRPAPSLEALFGAYDWNECPPYTRAFRQGLHARVEGPRIGRSILSNDMAFDIGLVSYLLLFVFPFATFVCRPLMAVRLTTGNHFINYKPFLGFDPNNILVGHL